MSKNDLVSVFSALSKKLPRLPNSPIPVQQVVTLYSEIANYYRVREEEITKREAIRRASETEIARIRANADLLREYFQLAFAERRENFDRAFAILEEAIQSGNNQQVEAALSIILQLVKESPIKQAAEIVQRAKNLGEGEIIDI